jgi:hypothetical protein
MRPAAAPPGRGAARPMLPYSAALMAFQVLV